jgi:drug/metabolite transporter (DMT)-like permease
MGVAWIPITIVAALSQTVRNALQRSLKGRLSTNGAAFTRFVFGLPFACVYLGVVLAAGVSTLPRPGTVFWGWLVGASLSQIAATSLLIHVMTARNFATAVAYAKTEVAQAAAFEIIFLGATVTWLGAAGVVLATVSVMLMSVSRSAHPLRALLVGWTEPSALLGLLAGGLFGVAAVGFRAASLSLNHPSIFTKASFTLVMSTALQTLVMGVYLALREPGELRRVAAAARDGVLVGAMSSLGSAGWFTAFTLQIAAYVRTLGLIELPATLLVSLYAFRERPSRAELLGLALLGLSIAMVLNGGR